MENLINLTRDLINFKTTQDNFEELINCVNYIENFFNDSEVNKYRYNFGKKPSIIITTKSVENKKPKIFLNGHIDVVESNEYKMSIVNDEIHGRGSCDMKSMVASLMIIFKNNLDKNLGLMITSDEEVGGFYGVNMLLNQVNWSCDLAIVPDGGERLGRIVIEEKGIIQLKIAAKGKSAHGSRPWLGINAIEKLFDEYRKITHLFDNTGKTWAPTCSLNVINAGKAVNQVPEYAEAKLDIRYPSLINPDELFEKIKSMTQLELEKIKEANPMIIDPNNKYLQKMIEITKKNINKEVVLCKEEGASDARFFSAKNIPVIMFSPENFNSAHSTNERVSITELKLFHEILNEFIKSSDEL